MKTALPCYLFPIPRTSSLSPDTQINVSPISVVVNGNLYIFDFCIAISQISCFQGFPPPHTAVYIFLLTEYPRLSKVNSSPWRFMLQ